MVVSQVLPRLDDKTRRIYGRLIRSLGGAVDSDLLARIKPEQLYGVPAIMALPRAAHQDAAAMEAYFADPGYTLNNLGEGVYGWMTHIDRQDGWLTIPNSAGKQVFLSVFVNSAINRDLAQRATGELPDPSLVPQLFVEANCPTRVYLNGQRVAEGSGRFVAEDAPLRQGINRLVCVCSSAGQDIRLAAWFQTKHGNPLSGLTYSLTLD